MGGRRFPCGEKEGHDAELLRKYIFGGHVGEYMEQMEEDDEELYKTHFARYIENDVTNDNMEDTWQAVYDKIREDPTHKKSDRKCPAKKLRRKAKLSASAPEPRQPEDRLLRQEAGRVRCYARSVHS